MIFGKLTNSRPAALQFHVSSFLIHSQKPCFLVDSSDLFIFIYVIIMMIDPTSMIRIFASPKSSNLRTGFHLQFKTSRDFGFSYSITGGFCFQLHTKAKTLAHYAIGDHL